MTSGSSENSSKRSVRGVSFSRSPIGFFSSGDQLGSFLSGSDDGSEVPVHLAGRLIPTERSRDVLSTFLAEVATEALALVDALERIGEGRDVGQPVVLAGRCRDLPLWVDQDPAGSDHLWDRRDVLGDH